MNPGNPALVTESPLISRGLTRFTPNAIAALGSSDLSTAEYFHSPTTGLFHARNLLTVDAPVKEAAAKCDVHLEWDDEGRLHKLNFFDTRKLLDQMGLRLMTPREYWHTLSDAHRAGDQLMVHELIKQGAAQWLDVVFVKKDGRDFMIEHPTITSEGVWDRDADEKCMVEIEMPKGRHGWIVLHSLDKIFDVIDPDTGFPRAGQVVAERGREGIVFKFWDMHTPLANDGVAAIRGSVTSAGTPSLDCAIPPSTKDGQRLFLRTARASLPDSPMDPLILSQLNQAIQAYDTAMQKGMPQEFRVFETGLLSLCEQLSAADKNQLRLSQAKGLLAIREKLADMLGYVVLEAQSRGDQESILQVERLELMGTSHTVTFDALRGFLLSARIRLAQAMDISHPCPVVFVMGHRNPDTDTVVSSLLEAFRQSLINPDIVYVPVIQSDRIPDEVHELLSDPELIEALLLTDVGEDQQLYGQALASGLANWILVDQNESPVQKFVISILDHHTPSAAVLDQDTAKTIEIVGSTTGMVVQRMLGMGLSLSPQVARIALGATLMDTENRSPLKMTHKDRLVMDHLQCHTLDLPDSPSETAFFQSLMHPLLSTQDLTHLFRRDYKDEWGFGFSVAKMKGVFNRDHASLTQQGAVEELTRLAAENNREKGLPLTLVKIVDYEDDDGTVFQERMLFVFAEKANRSFREKLLELFALILKNEFSHAVVFERLDGGHAVSFQWRGVGKQLSRKKVAPLLKPVVDAFNEYFYSEELGLFVMRDFQRKTAAVEAAAARLGITLSTNEQGYINFITPYEVLLLMKELGAVVMTPHQYATSLGEAKAKEDHRAVASLCSQDFVEVLGSVVMQYDDKTEIGRVILEPQIKRTPEGTLVVAGSTQEMRIPRAKPGLFSWNQVDPETGLPARVYSYGDDLSGVSDTLSRYWSPRPGEPSIFARGSIDIYGITCLDGKISPTEVQPNMGVRPCRVTLRNPDIDMKVHDGRVVVKITSDEGENLFVNGVPAPRQIEETPQNEFPVRNITKTVQQELYRADKATHTLDLFPYLAAILPPELFGALENKTLRSVQLHAGPHDIVLKSNPGLLEGFQSRFAHDPDNCLIGWHFGGNPVMGLDLIITDVRGRSKMLHLLEALYLAGVLDK